MEIKKLQETAELMASSDYKERFMAEYYQVKIRVEKLENFIAKIRAISHCEKMERERELDKLINHDCDIIILEDQLETMQKYLFLLKQRAVIENINLF